MCCVPEECAVEGVCQIAAKLLEWEELILEQSHCVTRCEPETVTSRQQHDSNVCCNTRRLVVVKR